jgi:hypothetical protein
MSDASDKVQPSCACSEKQAKPSAQFVVSLQTSQGAKGITKHKLTLKHKIGE